MGSSNKLFKWFILDNYCSVIINIYVWVYFNNKVCEGWDIVYLDYVGFMCFECWFCIDKCGW